MSSSKLFIPALALIAVTAGIASFFLAGVAADRYEGVVLLVIPVFLLVIAPAFRMARLGAYLRTNGLDSIKLRGSFQTRDDHFLLDYATGRWFRHATFFLGYLAIAALYFTGWLLLGLIWSIVSVPVLAVMLLVSKLLVTRFLSPFDPTEVASAIELAFPTRPLNQLPIGTILIGFAFFYVIAIEYLSPNLIVFTLLAVSYILLTLYFAVIRRRLDTSHKPR